MKTTTIAAIFVAALLFFSFGCIGEAGPKIAPSGNNQTPPSDIPPPPSDSGAQPAAPTGGDAPPPPAPV
ncbi:MAG: hypothetical protein NTX79_03675 [Candidatus Micrarchaeota archaeon]|nr:hypothetical protein [Candidatus Micrarchaeota archaeon]